MTGKILFASASVRSAATELVRIALLSLAAIFCASCSSLNLTMQDVQFEEPSEFFTVKPLEPGKAGTEPVLLRFAGSHGGKSQYMERTRIYMQIEGERGIPLFFSRNLSMVFSDQGAGKPWLLKSSSVSIPADEGSSDDTVEFDSRGGILRCLSGSRESRDGVIRIEAWTRDPIFPEGKVSVGDKWSYHETIHTSLESFWVSRESTEPDSIKADCKLEGFVEINGNPCAVIVSKVKCFKKETIGAFFRTMTLRVASFASETMYFNFKEGKIEAKVVETKHFTTSEDGDFSDYAESRTITRLLPDEKKQQD